MEKIVCKQIMIRSIFLFVLMSVSLFCFGENKQKQITGKTITYNIPTIFRTYFKLDDKKRLFPYIKNGKRFFEVEESLHRAVRQFNTRNTLLIIMDPWCDFGDKKLNTAVRKCFYAKILPLTQKFIELDFPVIVLTNAKNQDGYGYDIFPELEKLAQIQKLKIVYHQEWEPDVFAKSLHKRGINQLVYCGFASNMCVIGRKLGIIRMQQEGFRIFFVSDASAAVEYMETWENQNIHKMMTTIISQTFAELIDVDDVLKLRK